MLKLRDCFELKKAAPGIVLFLPANRNPVRRGQVAP